MPINHLQHKTIILLSSLLLVFGSAISGEPGPEISIATNPAATPQDIRPALQGFNASFKLTRGGLKIGTMDVTLQLEDDGHYVYKTRSRPVRWLGWFFKDHLNESSRGVLSNGNIKPATYTYTRSGGKKEKHAVLKFDWETMTVENNVDNTPWKMDIPDGVLDRLVVQLAMMQSLTDGKKVMSYQIADGGKLKQYDFVVIGTETIDLPAGRFETIKLKKQRSNQKRDTTLWCALVLGYLPVRIWQREKDDSEYQSDLVSFTYVSETRRKH
jgi:hypothetical protein